MGRKATVPLEEVLRLKAEGKSHNEIAARYGVTKNAISNVLRRARERGVTITSQRVTKTPAPEVKRVTNKIEGVTKPMVEIIDTSKDPGPDPNLGGDRSGHPGEWAIKSREAREKFAEAVEGHQGSVVDPEENEPARVGGSWLSRLNDAAVIKQLQKTNRAMEGRIGVLEELAAGLEAGRRSGLRGSPKSSPRQEQVLDLLSDGKVHSFRQVEKALKCSDAAVRNAVKSLREKGKVKVRKVKGKGRVQLDQSVQDLL